MNQGRQKPGKPIGGIEDLDPWEPSKHGIDPKNTEGTCAKERDDHGGHRLANAAQGAAKNVHDPAKPIKGHDKEKVLEGRPHYFLALRHVQAN